MRKEARFLLLIPVVLAGLAALVWFVMMDPAAEPEPAPPPDVAKSQPDTQDPALVSAAPERELSQSVPVVAPDPTVAPPAYVSHLGAFQGRLVEEDGTPVVGLPVAAVAIQINQWLMEPAALLSEEFATPLLVHATDETDEEGTFLLAGLEPRAMHVLGLDLGGPRSGIRILEQSPVTGQTVDLGTIVMEPFVTFVGQVRDQQGRPVPGARVRAVANVPGPVFQFGIQDIRRGVAVFAEIEEQSRFLYEVPDSLWQLEDLLPIPTTYTDENGDYRLPGVPIGIIGVTADKPDYLGAALPAVPSGRLPERRITPLILMDGGVVRGTVQDQEERPLVGAEVMVGAALPMIPIPVVILHPAGVTDAKGEFVKSGLPLMGPRYVAVRRFRGDPWKVDGPFTDPTVLVTFDSGRILRMYVQSADGPLDQEVELFATPTHPMIGLLPPVLSPPMRRLNDVTLVEPGLLEVEGVREGTYAFMGRTEGHALAQTDVTVTEDGENVATLTFEAAHEILITVQGDEPDDPLEWAFVTVSPPEMAAIPVGRSRTNEDGQASFPDIPAGRWRLDVAHPAWSSQTLEVDIPGEPVVVTLTRGGHLKGRVHDDGAPPPKPVFLVLQPRDGDTGLDGLTTTLTSEDGSFLIPNIRPGRYGWEVRDRLVGKGPLALFLTLRDDPLAKDRVTIEEGVTAELDVDISGVEGGAAAWLAGEIRLNGMAIEGLAVRYEAGRSRTVETGEDGRFDLGKVRAGEGRLEVQDVRSGDFMSLASMLHTERLELTVGESRFLDLHLEVGRVSGRVSGPGILPTTMGMVQLEQQSGGTRLLDMTDLLGFYDFPTVPPGQYTISVRSRAAASYTDKVFVQAGDNLTLDIKLFDGGELSGYLELPEGVTPEQLRRPRVNVINEAGLDIGQTSFQAEDLTFRTRGVPPGLVRVQLRVGRTQYRSEPIQVPEGGLRDVVVTLKKVERRPRDG